MPSLHVESWIWYAVVIIVAGSRFISRRMTLGAWRSYQTDDYLMLAVLCFYTTNIATINIVYQTSSNLLPPGFDVNSLTPADRAERIFGSKLILVVEQTQCVTIWGAKICLILLYHRLTQLRWENVGIKILGAYVIITFIVMEVLYFGVWCRPFYEYWAVPTNSIQCDAATNHLITNATFNLSSDLIMLTIGLPMFLRMKLPWRKKLPLVAVFSLGVFVMLAAILNKVYSFTEPFGNMWTYWYVRESSTALLVANLPFVWKFWRRISGFESTAPGSRPDTVETPNLGTNNRSKRQDSMLNLHDFLTEWPAGQSDSTGDADRSLPRFGSQRSTDKSNESRIPEHGPPAPGLVLSDGPPKEIIRRDSAPRRPSSVAPATPASSAWPSLDARCSTGSFV